MGHMTEAKRPTSGRATTETDAGAKSPSESMMSAQVAAPIRTRRLSKMRRRNAPAKQPAVMRPQNQETARAPVVCGSYP